MSKHTYTQHDEGVHWETHVSPSTLYGWFEHKVHGGDGGLWFGPRDDGTPGIMLIDFDGRAALPIEVGLSLIKLGYHVEPVNFADEAEFIRQRNALMGFDSNKATKGA